MPTAAGCARNIRSIRSEYVRQPWLALAPDVLRRVGYVTTDAAGMTTYNAPGLDMLLSDGFVQDHCFHLRAESGRVGMVFEPIPERRRTPEIRGTLWLDRASTQLTALEYRYTNIPSEQADEARGDMSFARMKNGAWAISGWSIRMPALEVPQGPQATRNPIPRVAEIHVTGGELALARIGTDTIWTRPPLTLAGTIVDSVSDKSIANARRVHRRNPARRNDRRQRALLDRRRDAWRIHARHRHAGAWIQ